MHTGNMPLPPAPKLSLTDSDRKQLLEISRHRSTPRGIVLRVDILLGAAEGIANHVLARNLSTSLPTVLLLVKNCLAKDRGKRVPQNRMHCFEIRVALERTHP